MNYCKKFRIRTKNKKYYYYCSKQKKIINKEECYRCELVETRGYKNKNPQKSGKIKNKSNKLAKLERSRKSVFTDDLEHCYLCGQARQEIHEIFCGKNRLNSIKYNFTLPLCHKCHSLNQNNADFNDFWHKKGQMYFEENIGSREEFLRVFRRNYLD